MRDHQPLALYQHSVALLVILTMLFQISNFLFDWKAFKFHDHIVFDDSTVDAGDNRQYSGIATNLLLGKGYTAAVEEVSVRQGMPTYLRTPGLPLLYTIPLFLFCRDSNYSITDSNRTRVWLFLYVLHLTLACIGTAFFWKLCQLLLRDPCLSLLGSVSYLIWPSNLVFLAPSAGFLPEPVVTPVLIWMFYILLSNDKRFVNILAGLVLGYCILIRIYLIILPFSFLLVSIFFQDQALRRRLVIIPLIAVAAFLPWPMRNYIVFNDFSLSSQGGRHLFYGNNASARGSADGIMFSEGIKNPERYPVLRELENKYPGLLSMTQYTETEASTIFRREALLWMKEEPRSVLWLMVRKLAITFYPTNYENKNKVNILTLSGFALFMPGLLLFLCRFVKKIEAVEFSLLTIPILCQCAVTLVFFAEYRTRFVMEPFVLLFAFYGLSYLTIFRGIKLLPLARDRVV